MLLPLIICAAFAASVFVLVMMLFGNRSDVSRRIAELEDTATPQTTHHAPPIVRRLLSGVDKTAVAAKLAEAGWYGTTVTKFVVSRVIGFGVAAGIGTFLLFALVAVSPLSIALVAGAAIFGFIAPTFVLDDAVKKRKIAIGNRMPDMLDMISTTVEAGVALNAALASATASLDGPLSQELEMVLSDIRVGRNRADAFAAMSQRAHQVDLSAFVMAITQTERLGGNIGHVLDELAEEARSRRLQRAEEIAAALPVKMVLPMAFFMLPALFTMIFAPVAAQLLGK